MRHLYLSSLLILPLLLCGTDLTIEATVDKTIAQVGEEIILTIRISGKLTPPTPQIPKIPNVDIQTAGSSRNITWINGKLSAEVIHTYILIPKKEGEFTIPPITVTVKGTTYSTSPITVQVKGKKKLSALNLQGPGKKDAYLVEMVADKQEAHPYTPIILTFRFWCGGPLADSPEYLPPSAPDFWKEPIGKERIYQIEKDGTMYSVYELKYILYPTKPGTLTIEPAIVHILPGRSLWGRYRTLKTDSISIVVLPFPKPIPENFSGAVGEFSLSLLEVEDTIAQGEPIHISIKLSGTGNFPFIKTIPLAYPYRTYTSKAEDKTRITSQGVTGEKVFHYLVFPDTSGSITLPTVYFPYLDIKSGEYKILTLPQIPIYISPSQTGGTKAKEGIRYIKTSPSASPPFSPLVLIIPALLYLLCGTMRVGWQTYLKQHPGRKAQIERKNLGIRLWKIARKHFQQGKLKDGYHILKQALELHRQDDNKEYKRLLEECNKGAYSPNPPVPSRDLLKRAKLFLK